MTDTPDVQATPRGPLAPLTDQLRRTPIFAYQVGLLAAVLLEMWQGQPFARLIGFRKVPRFFGIVDIFEPFSGLDFSGILGPFFPPPSGIEGNPFVMSGTAILEVLQTLWLALWYQGRRDPGFLLTLGRVIVYDVVIFVLPVLIIAFVLRAFWKSVLPRMSVWLFATLHLALLGITIQLWGGDGGTRELVLIFMGINVIMSISLNLINGFMGEFSVGHAAFMAVGAYVSSLMNMWLFVDDRVFGAPLLPEALGPTIGFPISLIVGGLVAGLVGLLVAFPSFRTRGDYLAIVTLAVNFIVQSLINNIDAIGGARGLNGVPLWSNLPWTMAVSTLSVVAVYVLVKSTFGKGIIAIREDEIAADLMGVNTKQMKLVAFMVSSFLAGVAGGLFAHVLAYINPGNFGILKSTESLVMVYLGGMGSISGAIVAAVVFTLLVEALRPLAILKWVVIPLILINLMHRRPQGLLGFTELSLYWGREPHPLDAKEDAHVAGED